jgi:aromatic-L-amino-acid decarboxylase
MTDRDPGIIREDADEFRSAVERATGWMVDYFSHPERYPVLSRVKPGAVSAALPPRPPEDGRTFQALLDDFEQTIVPGITHWNHPSFFAYFAISGSMPGILGEYLSAALNVNGMLWRTSPALTELEIVTLGYLRDMLGLPESLFGMILDTASTSSLVALAAAREALPDLQIRIKGMAGRPDLPPLVLYTSRESHSSVEKAAIVLGIGQDNVRKIGVDDRLRMDAGELERRIEQDLASGKRPFCVVATVGTTSSTSIDPVPAIAAVCRRFSLWLHVDAAYAGIAAILPEMRLVLDGCQQADSLVVNPHKWLATPIDLSAFYCRKPEILKNAFSLIPEYLRTGDEGEVTNLMDYGFQLGRRFRALKLWMVINYFGVKGLQSMIRGHLQLAKVLAARIEESPLFELMAPVPFSTLCFRFNPYLQAAGVPVAEDRERERELQRLNETLLETVNATGSVYLSHTQLNGKYALRCAIGNMRTARKHIDALWEILDTEARSLNSP